VPDVPTTGWRARLRATRAGSWALKAIVLLAGGFFIAVGLVLVVLPGPLTIPPVLLGLYIWSTEFAWADRWRVGMVAQGRVAWGAARRRPVHTAAVTVGGIVLLVVGLLAARKYDFVDRVLGSFG
jgi:hypothetical protein